MKSKSHFKVEYTPRDVFREFHKRSQRWACLVAHRRAGKTVACINELVRRAIDDKKKDGRYVYLSPYYTQSKDVAWSYLKQYSRPLWAMQPNESELRVDLLNGSRIRLYGADNADRMRGLYIDGCVIDEPALIRPNVWGEVLRPALSDRKGWAVFIGTPMGHNHFYDLLQEAKADPSNWYSTVLPSSLTNLIDETELAVARKTMTEEQYAQEFECSFEAAILGAYYAKEMTAAQSEERITRVPHDPALSVETFWDLGHSDATAVWFVQRAFNEYHFIDFFHVVGSTPALIVGEINRRRDELKYVYSRHVWPHDGGHKTLASAGRPLSSLFADLGLTVEVQPRADVQVGIEQVRLILPLCWFDAGKCAMGLEALRNYRKEWDEMRRKFKDKPLHDWCSDPADALRTGAMASYSYNASKPKRDRYEEKSQGVSSWAS